MATGNRRARHDGFSLIELSIAVFILAIIMAVSVPSFLRSYNAAVLNSTGRTLATTCQFARLNAVLHQKKVSFNVDMDRKIVWLTEMASTNELESAGTDNQVLKTVEIPQRVTLVAAQRADDSPQQRGQVEVTFYPNGTCDAFTITLRGTEKGSGLAVMVDGVTGHAGLYPIKI